MPQLMPLYWSVSFLMVLFLFMMGLKLYFSLEVSFMLKEMGGVSEKYWVW